MTTASSSLLPTYALEPAPQPSLAISGTDSRFPIRRVYCIGRNYAAHAVEMGHDPNKEPPFFFQKNPNNVVAADQGFEYPTKSEDVHFEIELVVALGKGGTNIPVADAASHVFAYGVGLDMTRRDLQSEAKDLRRPWEIGKAFEKSAPCGALVPISKVGELTSGAITLDVNGERRQTGDLNQMIWKIPEMISYLSDYFELAAGDLILTGTPSGVGAIKLGDVMTGSVEGVGKIEVAVV